MEKLLWLDGHVTSIDEKGCLDVHKEIINDDYVWVLHHNGFEFEWHNNMWMQR